VSWCADGNATRRPVGQKGQEFHAPQGMAMPSLFPLSFFFLDPAINKNSLIVSLVH
jgi:hypothetical protein